MESIGIDFKILLSQIVNFLILFFLLSWLLYKPILKILNQRRKKIEESMALAEKTKKESEELDQKTREMIEKTKKEALGILEETKQQAEKNKKEIQAQASKEAEFLMKKAEERIREQKQEMMRELRQETVNLTIITTEKLLAKNIDKTSEEKFVKEVIDRVEK